MSDLDKKMSIMTSDIEKLGNGEMSDSEFKVKYKCTDAQLKEARAIFDEFGPDLEGQN